MNPIEKIIIKGFKAFPEEFVLQVNGKHLLMYGENGSGKSSIYFALHCLFQSQLKPDKGIKYFSPTNSQNIVNKHKYTAANQSYVEVRFKSHPHSYKISDAGYQTDALPQNDLIQVMNEKVIFVNHKFIFNFSNSRNSEEINLFPVFYKDILPFTKDRVKTTYMDSIYNEIIKVSKAPNSRTKHKTIASLISGFNTELEFFLEQINLKLTNFYNGYFKDEEELKLRIKLKYEGNNRLNYIRPIKTRIKGGSIISYEAQDYELVEPKIEVEICELLADNSEVSVKKPHVYFNEAKLTAIALSIRFATLDLTSAADGRFLALDDMLISLDMNNRTKVVDFLLGISDNYMIYLFTHDRGFFEIIKRKIYNQHEVSRTKVEDNWNYAEIYENEDSTLNPVKKKSETFYAQALNQFKQHDYPAAANYLRKAVEELIQRFPEKICRKNNGDLHERLRSCLDNAIILIKKMDNDIQDLQDLRDSLDLLLNPLSHRNQDYDIYKTDLLKVFKIIPQIEKHIKELDIKEVIARDNYLYMYFRESGIITQKYKIRLKEELYSFNVEDDRFFTDTDCKSEESLTITSGIDGAWAQNNHFTGSLDKICEDVHIRKGVPYQNNYIDFYKDKDDNDLITLI
jgi:energy-coupling factor transporter ATP-binding protein EcfA2